MTKNSESAVATWDDPSNSKVPEILNTPKSENVSRFDEEIDSFFGKINEYSDKFSQMTKKLVGFTLDQSNLHPWWPSRDVAVDDVDSFFNRPYQSRSTYNDESLVLPELFKSPLDIFSLFSEASGVTPFGLFAYQGPSTKQYNTCMKKEGVSLWDADGYWRCLFPSGQIPPKFLEHKKKQLAGQIVTKDDFEDRARDAVPDSHGAIDLGQQGIFFKQFGDFLNWKNASYEKEKQLEEQRREEYRKSVQYALGNTASDGEKKVVGTSLNSTTNSENGETVLKEVRTEYFSDGSSVTNSVVKRKPVGAETWDTVEEKSEQRNAKQGWLWK